MDMQNQTWKTKKTLHFQSHKVTVEPVMTMTIGPGNRRQCLNVTNIGMGIRIQAGTQHRSTLHTLETLPRMNIDQLDSSNAMISQTAIVNGETIVTFSMQKDSLGITMPKTTGTTTVIVREGDMRVMNPATLGRMIFIRPTVFHIIQLQGHYKKWLQISPKWQMSECGFKMTAW